MPEPVAKLVPRSEPSSKGDVIEVLEQVLEEARAGRISTVAIAFVDESRTVQTSWAHDDSLHLLACGVELQRAIAEDCAED